MPRATALGALGPLLLLLLPLPRGAGGLGGRQVAAADAWAAEGAEGAEGAEPQLGRYHDPCKAGRCRREVRPKFAFEMQMGWWASGAAVRGAGPPPPPRPPGPPGDNAPEERPKRRSGRDVRALGWRRARVAAAGAFPKRRGRGRGAGRLTAGSARAARAAGPGLRCRRLRSHGVSKFPQSFPASCGYSWEEGF